jgi:hypothetical protein
VPQDWGHWCFKTIDSAALAVEHAAASSAEGTGLVNALSTMIDSEQPVVYLADLTSAIALRSCAAGVERAAPVLYPLLADANISC